MQEIRERVRKRSASVPLASRAAAGFTPVAEVDLNDVLRLVDHARRCSAVIGDQPPRPPTLRGRVGAVLVRLVRRTLFWYTPQITDFNEATLRVLEEQVAALESVATRLHARMASLEQRLVEPEPEPGADDPRP